MNQVDTAEWALTISPDQIPALVYPVVRIDGSSWYADQGFHCIDGGRDSTERLWLSPTWFETTSGDLDGDGVSWVEGDCDDGDPYRHPYAIESCTNGIDDDCDHLVDTMDDDCDFDEPTPSMIENPHEDLGGYSPSMMEIGVGPDINKQSTHTAIPERKAGGCSSMPNRSNWLFLFGLTVFLRRERSQQTSLL